MSLLSFTHGLFPLRAGNPVGRAVDRSVHELVVVYLLVRPPAKGVRDVLTRRGRVIENANRTPCGDAVFLTGGGDQYDRGGEN